MVVKEFLEDMYDEEERRTALKAWKWIKRGAVGLAALIGVIGSIYTIQPDSVGVVKRFGKYVRQEPPGIHLKIPYKIETVDKVPVQKVHLVECGFRTLEAGVNSRYIGREEIEQGKVSDSELSDLVRQSGERIPPGMSDRDFAIDMLRREYLMLTGDLNLADVEWIVQYTIKDASSYLFNLKEPELTVRDASQSVMRQLIGNGSIDEAITIGRTDYETQGKEILQKLLDTYNTGIHVVALKIQSSHPPERVRDAFNAVNQAQQNKEKRINQAMASYNEEVPRVEGEAKAMIERADGYALKRVNEADGDAKKFNSVYEQYSQAPAITRQRMYLETMNKVLPQIDEKWLVEEDLGGLLKILNITDLKPLVPSAEGEK